jgi:transposase
MNPNELFTMALQLSKEWRVVRTEFSGDPPRLELWLDFQPGTKFPDPESGELSPVHDTVERSWRHLSFWQYETVLTARVPRIKAPDGAVRQVEVPWARPGSGFTLLFEAFAMLLCREMPVSASAEILGEHDTRIWRVVKDYVLAAHAGEDWSSVTRIAVDETSARKGHRYVTNVIDADTGKLLFMHPGRSAETLGEFKKALQAHGGDPKAIAVISMDMSPAYRKGAAEHFPDAKIVFDKFHVMLLAGKALDEVRKLLQRQGADLKGSMWSLRGNEWNLRPEQLEERRRLCG